MCLCLTESWRVVQCSTLEVRSSFTVISLSLHTNLKLSFWCEDAAAKNGSFWFAENGPCKVFHLKQCSNAEFCYQPAN